MKTITVFTPTYNRAHLLPRLYKSLCDQTNKNFIWLVIDDGSVDKTKELVSEWKLKGEIEIEYHYKENGGMHTGHNAAYQRIVTELNVCIDSDDFMPIDAIDKILLTWNKVSKKDNIAGIVGLDSYIDGSIVGTKIPKDLRQGDFFNLYKKHNVKGDKKVVLRTAVIKNYPPYPEYDGEKLVPLGLLYQLTGMNYDYIYSNDVYCIVDYQLDGSSSNIFKQYKQSPKGFAYAKTKAKVLSNNIFFLSKLSIQIGSFAIFAKDLSLINKKPKRIYNFLLFPFGIVLNLYIRYRINKIN